MGVIQNKCLQWTHDCESFKDDCLSYFIKFTLNTGVDIKLAVVYLDDETSNQFVLSKHYVLVYMSYTFMGGCDSGGRAVVQ